MMALFKKRRSIKVISILDGDDPLGEYLRWRYLRDSMYDWEKDFCSRIMLRLSPPWEELVGHGDSYPIQLVDNDH